MNDDFVDPSQNQSFDPQAPAENLDFVEPEQPVLNPSTSQLSNTTQPQMRKNPSTRGVKDSAKKQRNSSGQPKPAAAANAFNNSQQSHQSSQQGRQPSGSSTQKLSKQKSPAINPVTDLSRQGLAQGQNAAGADLKDDQPEPQAEGLNDNQDVSGIMIKPYFD